MYVLRGERTRNRLEMGGTVVPWGTVRPCQSSAEVKMGEKGVARSCLQARSDRANILSTGVKKSDFCGLCLGNVFGGGSLAKRVA